jgi:hypothetical protein
MRCWNLNVDLMCAWGRALHVGMRIMSKSGRKTMSCTAHYSNLYWVVDDTSSTVLLICLYFRRYIKEDQPFAAPYMVN